MLFSNLSEQVLFAAGCLPTVQLGKGSMASRISAVVRVRPLLPREVDVSVAEAVSVMEVSA